MSRNYPTGTVLGRWREVLHHLRKERTLLELADRVKLDRRYLARVVYELRDFGLVKENGTEKVPARTSPPNVRVASTWLIRSRGQAVLQRLEEGRREMQWKEWEEKGGDGFRHEGPCPDCGLPLVHQSGCLQCLVCGYNCEEGYPSPS